MRLSLPKKISSHYVIGLFVAGLLSGLCWFQQNRQSSREAVAGEPPVKQSASLRESFDQGSKNSLPRGWSRWSDRGNVSFEITAEKCLSEPHSLACTGPSSAVARAWLELPQPADVQVSAAVLMNTLIPAQVLVRGSRLDGRKPSYYAVSVTRGLEIQLLKVLNGQTSSIGTIKSVDYFSGKWARVTLSAKGKTLRAQLFRPDTKQYLDGSGEWQDNPAWVLEATDTEIVGGGLVGLGRPASYAGTLFFDDFEIGPPSPVMAMAPRSKPPGKRSMNIGNPATKAAPETAIANIPASDLPRPLIPRHYSHIRMAMLAYAGNPMGPLEDQLLMESVDLVIPSDRYLEHIHSVAPSTPQLVYVNTSSLYLDLLTDWLTYADRKGYSREAAFFHAAQPKPFRGDSPSSQPVTWFWSVYRGGSSLTWLTGAARGKSGAVRFPSAGESLYLGYPDPFREINLILASGARAGWSMVMEYPSAVDGNARPTSWTKLQTITDATSGLTQSGQITFDPPADWKTASIGDPKRLFYLRFRTKVGGEAPVATTILGRDYVGANGQTAGTIPVFDDKADANHDGYLDDAEYAHRAPGKDARFVYESRMVTENYGQMRYGTNVANPQYQEWAVNYCSRDMRRFPHAAGFFMDNSEGKAPVEPKDVLEPVASYAVDYGALLNRISKAIAPRWLLANTAGGQLRADPVIRQNPFYFEEFAIRPFSHHYGYFEDLAETMARRAALTSPPPLAVIDSHPQHGSPTDPRMQLATLAYYYLLADPEWTFLMFNGGFEPASSWTRHWCPAAAYDIGQPKEKWSVFASGSDPANPTLAFKVYQRAFTNALVLHKPLSYARAAKAPASTGDETATKHELPGTYRPLRADGTLGEATTSISLRNGEGAILVRSK